MSHEKLPSKRREPVWHKAKKVHYYVLFFVKLRDNIFRIKNNMPKALHAYLKSLL